MADITMCLGTGCPQKENCYRHTAPINQYRQAYFVKPPIKDDDSCEYYWPTIGQKINREKQLPIDKIQNS